MNNPLLKKLATVALLLVLSAAALAEPRAPGDEHFAPAPAPAQNDAPAAKDAKAAGNLMTAKRMTEICADEYAKRTPIAGDQKIFRLPWKMEDVKKVMRFYATRWWPDELRFDTNDPEQQRARNMYNALWAYSLEGYCRRQRHRLLTFIVSYNLTERLNQIAVSMECFDYANNNTVPLLEKFDEAYDAFMGEIGRLNGGNRLSYGFDDGLLPTGTEIFRHCRVDFLMRQDHQPKPFFDRDIRALDQACVVCQKSTLDELRSDLAKFRVELDNTKTAFRIAADRVLKLPAFNDIMYICSADDVINAAEDFYAWGAEMLKKLDDNGTIYGKLRHFVDIGRHGGLEQDGVSYSDRGVPVYRRKVRRGSEEMKAAYEKWAAKMSQKYDNVKQYLRWSN